MLNEFEFTINMSNKHHNRPRVFEKQYFHVKEALILYPKVSFMFSFIVDDHKRGPINFIVANSMRKSVRDEIYILYIYIYYTTDLEN